MPCINLPKEINITDPQWLEFTRSLLYETTAKFWTDVEILSYKAVAITNVAAKYVQNLVITNLTQEQLDVVATVPYVLLPVDCWKIIRIEYASDNSKVQLITPAERFKLGTPTPSDGPFSVMMGIGPLGVPAITLQPTPTVSHTSYFNIWYLPEPTDLKFLPTPLHALVAIEAVRLAKFKDEDVQRDLLDMQDRIEKDILPFMAVAQYMEPDRMDAFDSEENEFSDI